MLGTPPSGLQHVPESLLGLLGLAVRPQPNAVTTHAHRTDEFAAAFVGWSIECQQLGCGQFHASIFEAHTSRLSFMHVRCAPGVLIRAQPPAGVRVLLMFAQDVHGIAQRDGAIGRGAMLTPTGPIDLRVTHPFSFYLLATNRALIDDTAELLLRRRLDSVARDGQLTLDDPREKRAELARLAQHMRRGLGANPLHLRTSALAEAFEDAVLESFLCGIRSPRTYVAPGRRHALAWAAESYLRQNLTRPLTIHDLCRATGAGERTLHMAFKEHFDTTPKAYLKMLRMNGVRRELQAPENDTTVTAAAMRWGFWHLSWFSHDYRAMFGEPPGQTLRAARSSALAVLG